MFTPLPFFPHFFPPISTLALFLFFSPHFEMMGNAKMSVLLLLSMSVGAQMTHMPGTETPSNAVLSPLRFRRVPDPYLWIRTQSSMPDRKEIGGLDFTNFLPYFADREMIEFSTSEKSCLLPHGDTIDAKHEQNITFSSWIHPSSTLQEDWVTIFEKGDSRMKTLSIRIRKTMAHSTYGVFEIMCTSGANSVIHSKEVAPPAQSPLHNWMFISCVNHVPTVVSRKDSTYISLFVDGARTKTKGDPFTNRNEVTSIGCKWNGGNGIEDVFQGEMFDLMLWDSSLSEKQISSISCCGLGAELWGVQNCDCNNFCSLASMPSCSNVVDTTAPDTATPTPNTLTPPQLTTTTPQATGGGEQPPINTSTDTPLDPPTESTAIPEKWRAITGFVSAPYILELPNGKGALGMDGFLYKAKPDETPPLTARPFVEGSGLSSSAADSAENNELQWVLIGVVALFQMGVVWRGGRISVPEDEPAPQEEQELSSRAGSDDILVEVVETASSITVTASTDKI